MFVPNQQALSNIERVSVLIAFDRLTLGSVLKRLTSNKKLILRTSNKDNKRVKLIHISSEVSKVLRGIGPTVI